MSRNIFLEAFVVSALAVGIAAYFFGGDMMALLANS